MPDPVDLEPKAEDGKPRRKVGQGVPRRLVPSEDAGTVNPKPAVQEARREEVEVWQDTPSMLGQYEKFPDTVRPVDTRVDVFDLSNLTDREMMNEIMAKRVGATSTDPRVIIHEMEKQFYQGVFHVYMLHSKMQYKKLIPSKKDVGVSR